jgi:uncharacterized Tic20 family protein
MSVLPSMVSVTDDPNERSLAALAHLSMWLNFFIPGLGFIAALVIAVTQHQRSAFVYRQGIQAAIYQLFLLLLSIATFIVSLLIIFIGVGVSTAANSNAVWLIIPLLLLGLLMIGLFMLVAVLYTFVGAYGTYQGRDFRYPVVANLVDRV